MTPRERVLSVLAGKVPDRVPWFGDLDYWATSLICRGQKPASFRTSADYIGWHRELGVGFYLQGCYPFETVIENCGIKTWREGQARHRRIETPLGALTETWTWLPASFSEAPVERLVKTAADLPAYRYVYENTRYEPNYTLLRLRRPQVGDQGLVVGYLPKSPFMQLVALDAGIAAVVAIFAEAQEELAWTLAAVRQAHEQAAQLALESPAEVLMVPENLSSDVVGQRFYDMYLADCHRQWAAAIRMAGKHSCVHLDGTVKGLLRRVCAAGFSFVEALTPAPVGDLEVEGWADCSGNDRTILWGGLPGIYFTPHVTDGEFDRFVRRVLAVMRSQPRYVLGVADQVPPDGLAGRVRRVAELVEECG